MIRDFANILVEQGCISRFSSPYDHFGGFELPFSECLGCFAK